MQLKIMQDKAEVSKCSWYLKRKLGVTMHLSGIIKLEFGKERHTLLCILKLFFFIFLFLFFCKYC